MFEEYMAFDVPPLEKTVDLPKPEKLVSDLQRMVQIIQLTYPSHIPWYDIPPEDRKTWNDLGWNVYKAVEIDKISPNEAWQQLSAHVHQANGADIYVVPAVASMFIKIVNLNRHPIECIDLLGLRRWTKIDAIDDILEQIAPKSGELNPNIVYPEEFIMMQASSLHRNWGHIDSISPASPPKEVQAVEKPVIKPMPDEPVRESLIVRFTALAAKENEKDSH